MLPFKCEIIILAVLVIAISSYSMISLVPRLQPLGSTSVKSISTVGKSSSDSQGVEPKQLFDFTSSDADISGWSEVSDVVREPGMSKATLVLQRSRLFRRAVFFSLLNPQPNGAGFAGMRTKVQLDLSNYTAIQVRLRGQGANSHYKVNLRHRGLDDEPNPSYEQMFEAPMNEFKEISLPLSDFVPYFRGKKLDPKEVGYLDTSNITNFEFQMYGGVYLPYKQAGPSSLEIDWVKAI